MQSSRLTFVRSIKLFIHFTLIAAHNLLAYAKLLNIKLYGQYLVALRAYREVKTVKNILGIFSPRLYYFTIMFRYMPS